MIQLEINAPPVANRSTFVTRYGNAFNPRFKEKSFYQWQIKAQYNQQAPLCGPIKVTAAFYLPIPKGTSKIRRTQMLAGIMHHIKRPDTSNFYYFLENCLKGIVFEDDSQVVEIIARKIYGETPKTLVIVEKLNI
jgi:Holliday junction resolvase RusA-like endonuclease